MLSDSIFDERLVCFRSSTSWLAPKFSNCPAREHATGAVWLTDVRCRGNESSLDQCPHSEWGMAKGGCDSHTYDACLVCDNPQYYESGKIYFFRIILFSMPPYRY